jgi:hypothetical protein
MMNCSAPGMHFGLYRPWGIDTKWKTKGGWFHTDQNAVRRPGKVCVQGNAHHSSCRCLLTHVRSK